MTQAIFLSYASQDADAARRICDALRAVGLEVWFDQSELRGGDAWDASIRKQIKECALFVPMISDNTNAREEGYFRLEWKLAVDRSHLMADDKTFFVPIILDDAPEATSRVPDAFRARQWSRLNDETTIAAFAARMAKLVARSGSFERDAGTFATIIGSDTPSMLDRSLQESQRRANDSPTSASTGITNDAVASRTINPLSVMVMPFANHTGDKDKAYMADALTSSITSDLSRIRDAFIVPAATAFSLQGKTLTIPQLGKEAAVRFVLTGNVAGNSEKLRIGAVLSDTQTGAQLWAHHFDGGATDLFVLQDQVTALIGNTIGPHMVVVAARESEKRASTPKVADLLMRARALSLNQQTLKNHQAIESLYRQALALEPGNLGAKIGLAVSLSMQSGTFAESLKLDREGRIALAKHANDMAAEVKRVDPNNPDVYLPIARYAHLRGDLEGAVQAEKRRVELDPKNDKTHGNLGFRLILLGDMPSARAALEKALKLSSPARRPTETYANLSAVAFIEDRADEAIKWAQQAIDANMEWSFAHIMLALAYARLGDQVRASKAAAEALRINAQLRLNIKDDTPWPGKEAAYTKYIETQYLPAWRLAGLPE